MRVFRNILFPVDSSDHCVALRHDVEFMARACDAQLTRLHALPPPLRRKEESQFVGAADQVLVRVHEIQGT